MHTAQKTTKKQSTEHRALFFVSCTQHSTEHRENETTKKQSTQHSTEHRENETAQSTENDKETEHREKIIDTCTEHSTEHTETKGVKYSVFIVLVMSKN